MESWLTLLIRITIVVFIAICVHQVVESTSSRLVSKMFGVAEPEFAGDQTVEAPRPQVNPWPILAAATVLVVGFFSIHFLKFQKFTLAADLINQLGGRVDYQPTASSVLSAYLVSSASVDLSECEVADNPVPAFKHLRRLKTLRLAGAKFQQSIISEIARCKQLTALDLSSTPITDLDIATLAQLPSLKSLIVNDTGLSDDSIDSISKMKSLSHLECDNTQFSEAGLQKLGGLIFTVSPSVAVS